MKYGQYIFSPNNLGRGALVVTMDSNMDTSNYMDTSTMACIYSMGSNTSMYISMALCMASLASRMDPCRMAFTTTSMGNMAIHSMACMAFATSLWEAMESVCRMGMDFLCPILAIHSHTNRIQIPNLFLFQSPTAFLPPCGIYSMKYINFLPKFFINLSL